MTETVRPRAVRTSRVALRTVPDSDSFYEWVYGLPCTTGGLDGYRVVDEGASGFGWAEPDPKALERQSPRRHRTGTCFDVESSEMRAAAVPGLEAILGGDVTLHEVRHQHNGYHTDLVVADIDGGGLRRRDAMTVGREPLHDPLQRFKTWWYVNEHGPMPAAEAEDDGLYVDAAKNREHLTWLLDHGWLGRTCAGCLVALEPPRIAKLHAVELKLRDWETALEQAGRANRVEAPDWRGSPDYVGWRDRYGYADYRWVAMDAGGIRPALDNCEEFVERGVGLLAVAEGGTVVKHVDAEFAPRMRYTRDRAWAESEVWARLNLDEWLDSPAESGEAESEGSVQPGLNTFADGGERP